VTDNRAVVARVAAIRFGEDSLASWHDS
jgi:hypothetical protein